MNCVLRARLLIPAAMRHDPAAWMNFSRRSVKRQMRL
jgi:hypothetical protein